MIIRETDKLNYPQWRNILIHWLQEDLSTVEKYLNPLVTGGSIHSGEIS